MIYLEFLSTASVGHGYGLPGRYAGRGTTGTGKGRGICTHHHTHTLTRHTCTQGLAQVLKPAGVTGRVGWGQGQGRNFLTLAKPLPTGPLPVSPRQVGRLAVQQPHIYIYCTIESIFYITTVLYQHVYKFFVLFMYLYLFVSIVTTVTCKLFPQQQPTTSWTKR